MLKYPAIVHSQESGYWLEFPDLPGCATQGNDLEQLTEMAEDALSLHLGGLYDDGVEIPIPSRPSGDNIIYISVLPDTAIPILLQKTRKAQGLSQSDVAKRIGKTYQAYQRLEKAGSCNIRIKTLEKIARAMGKRVEVNLADRL